MYLAYLLTAPSSGDNNGPLHQDKRGSERVFQGDMEMMEEQGGMCQSDDCGLRKLAGWTTTVLRLRLARVSGTPDDGRVVDWARQSIAN